MKKILPVAVLAALAGANGAQAVHVNPDGLGQVLLYPFYTVEGGQDTYINLVNTTDATKAVKVRFRESLNSQEVLDFNLYLSPKDHWSAVVTADADGEGAVIRTGDTSCTVPNALAAAAEGELGATVPFRNFLFSSELGQPGVDRTREGYVEVIEMGEVTGASAAAALHADGVPADCASLEAAWSENGYWAANADVDMTAATGGLYGYGVLINVPDATNATYDAVALDAFTASILHFNPGTSSPNLGDADPIASLFDGSTAYTMVANTPIDAVSAVLMQGAIANDFVLEPSIGAGTDWVITMPTKGPYVETVVTAPFTSVWDGDTAQACEQIGFTYYDREERLVTPDPGGVDFSPKPADAPEPGFFLCAEANVLTFNDANVLESSERGTAAALSLADGYNNGWVEMDLGDQAGGAARDLVMATGETLQGLPVVGFAVQKYVNGTGEVLKNYAGAVEHKGVRAISVYP